MSIPVPEGAEISNELPDWVRLAIASAVVVFGRMEQEILEISWILKDAELKQRLKFARASATDNCIDVLESVERLEPELKLDEVKNAFRALGHERNLIVHGAWSMLDDKPLVVWHKFLEDNESVVGELFEHGRFDRFMKKAEHLLGMFRQFHDMLEAGTGKKTSAVPRT